ncbi:MAG: 5-formyltetrahydrofolate cyclo-ligase [Clostridia bacterium]|nr:5-formyltetrahydrofolate cyclo-ligase [Clostridia bacterium]
MFINDKTLLRKQLIGLRNDLDKEYCYSSDISIAEKLFECEEYINSDLILIYISVRNEINTFQIINHSFELGKKIAIPYCSDNKMYFYEISDQNELTEVQFGIPTVNPEGRNAVSVDKQTLCIVPALAFDLNGNRLGYGGGYYDRFLAENNVASIGLCRKDFILSELPYEDFDIRIPKVITD